MIKMLKIFALRAASTNGNDKMKVYIFRLSGTTVTGPSPILGKWLHAPPDIDIYHRLVVIFATLDWEWGTLTVIPSRVTISNKCQYIYFCHHDMAGHFNSHCQLKSHLNVQVRATQCDA